MEFIQICEYKGEAVTTSRAVAEQFGKQHKNVIRDIEEILTSSILGRVKQNPLNPKLGRVKQADLPTVILFCLNTPTQREKPESSTY